jgi:hypothetical protein
MPSRRRQHNLVDDLAHALDPVLFARERLEFEPDPWQAKLLRSTSQRIILNCSRQSGKSTTVAIQALHTGLYQPESLVLLVSPSLRQSKELFAKVVAFMRTLEPAEILEEDNKLSCTLSNHSRIVSLPGDQKTIRGFSGPALIVEDEASRVMDETHDAVRPMLAVSRGRLVLMSTPNGRQGHFYELWKEGRGWERIELPASECPRIGQEFLEQERVQMGPIMFEQEYCCRFHDTSMNVFSTDLIEAALVNYFPPFLQMNVP